MKLPTHQFDYVIFGTGLAEQLLSATLAIQRGRGKGDAAPSVLNLDFNKQLLGVLIYNDIFQIKNVSMNPNCIIAFQLSYVGRAFGFS